MDLRAQPRVIALGCAQGFRKTQGAIPSSSLHKGLFKFEGPLQKWKIPSSGDLSLLLSLKDLKWNSSMRGAFEIQRPNYKRPLGL
jgi:hypothetical protein